MVALSNEEKKGATANQNRYEQNRYEYHNFSTYFKNKYYTDGLRKDEINAGIIEGRTNMEIYELLRQKTATTKKVLMKKN